MRAMTFFAIFAAIVLAIIFIRFFWFIVSVIVCFGTAYYFACGYDGSFDPEHFWQVFAVLAASMLVFKTVTRMMR